MKTRNEILAKAETLAPFDQDTTEGEARSILLEIAGPDEADMCSTDGTFDLLATLDRDDDETVQAASKLVYEFLR